MEREIIFYLIIIFYFSFSILFTALFAWVITKFAFKLNVSFPKALLWSVIGMGVGMALYFGLKIVFGPKPVSAVDVGNYQELYREVRLMKRWRQIFYILPPAVMSISVFVIMVIQLIRKK